MKQLEKKDNNGKCHVLGQQLISLSLRQAELM